MGKKKPSKNESTSSELSLTTINDDKTKTKKDDKKDDKKPVGPKVTFGQLFRYADTLDYILMIWGFVGAAGQGAIMPSFSFIFGELINAFNATGEEFLSEILRISIYFLYAGAGALVVIYAQTAFWNLTAVRQITRIRERYLKAILRQEVAWFDVNPTGELTTRIASDTIVIQEAIGDKVGSFVQFMSTAIFGFALGFAESWKLSLVMLAITPLLAVAGAFMMKLMASLTLRGQAAYAAAGAFANEVISGMRTIASFASEPKAFKHYSVGLDGARKLGIRTGVVSGLGIGITMFIFFGAYGLALWYGSTLVVDGELTGGQILTCFFALLIGAFSLGQASPSVEAIARGQGAAYKIFETIDRVPDIDSSSTSGKVIRNLSGDIKITDLFFSYPTRPEVAVFNGLNLSIKAGQTVALVGHSGSGKSSIVSLIQRFYDPDDGNITLDNKNLKNLNVKWLRQQIGLVGQEPVLFSGSIAENIGYGKEGATSEEIEAAARASNAHNFIMDFPDKYNTQVGEKGAQMSGGQKQRIAIARAIVKNPKILLLDEATSALDTESEKIVQDALNSVMKGRTTIIVAHRLSTIRDADLIAVVHEGKIGELGTHDELMAKNGLYFDLVKLQSSKKEDKSKDAKSPQSKKWMSESINIDSKEEKIDSKEEATKYPDVPFSRIAGLNKPEIPYILLGCLTSAINGVVNPIFAIIFAEMVALFYKPAAEIEANVWKWAVGFAAVGFAPLISMGVGTGLFAVAGQRLIQRLREQAFRAILRQNIAWFDNKENATGTLTSRLASEATLVESLVGTRIGLTVQNLAAVIAGLTIAFIYGWKLTLVVLATSPIIAFSNFMQMNTMKNFSEKFRKANESANQVATESFGNIRTVASFTYENKIVEAYIEKMRDPVALAIRNAHTRGFLTGLGQFFLFSSYTLSFWYGGKLIYDGEMDFADVMKVFFAVVMIASSVGQTASMTPDAAKARRAASMLFGIIDRTPEIDSSSEEGKKLDNVVGQLELKNISFVYPTRPDAPVLKKFSLTVKPGNVVALVGHSGCGKSSTIALLERFYDPQDGEICLDGVNIKDLNLRWYRKQVGLVGQEPVLFSGTIAENISYGKEGATQEEIEAAAKASNAHNFIMEFPDQYKTEVGEKGAQLSGGQKQRIAIARAIIKNPKILLLDEATSALDTESEKIVQETLNSVMKGRTTIVIAHRLSTIKTADTIAVVNKGKIAEIGTHDELIAKNGLYYKLVERQTS